MQTDCSTGHRQEHPRLQDILAGRFFDGSPIGSEPKGSGGGFLGALQERLDTAASGKAATKLDWQDDGTVIVAQGETGALAEHWLAGQLGDPASVHAGRLTASAAILSIKRMCLTCAENEMRIDGERCRDRKIFGAGEGKMGTFWAHFWAH